MSAVTQGVTPIVETTLTVTILAPFQCVFDGVVSGAGEKATVPSSVGTAWVLYGWAVVSE